MVVLDAIHQIQANQANDLACRWNCKAGKCGSCSAEVNGMPKLLCMSRLSELPLEKPITIEPLKAFPLLKDLVTDVSWNFAVKKKIKPFKPRAPDAADGTWRMAQADIDRVQEFRKCIECFLCQDVCHVLREHRLHEQFIGPRFLIHVAALEMHPLDTEDQQDLAILVLAITDRFDKFYAVGDSKAQEIVGCLRNEYERAYYSGIICERRAKAYLHQGTAGAGANAYEKLREAMQFFEGA